MDVRPTDSTTESSSDGADDQAGAAAGDTLSDDRAELLELEHEAWQALCTGQDEAADFYAAVMLDGALMVSGDGTVMSREVVVDALRESPAWDTYSIDEPTVVPVADVVRALVYHGTGHRGDTDFRGAMTSVYVRTPEGWRLALFQQTPSA